jgi:Helicase HerA, central domain/Type IV secretion-system coupling protein DNA-binding domain
VTIALVLLLGGLVVFALILVARAAEADAWRRSLIAYRLRLPASLTVDEVSTWLTGIAASTHPPRWSLLPLPPVAVEIVATAQGLMHYVLVTNRAEEKLLAGLRSALPGVRLEAVPDFVSARPHLRLAAEAIITSFVRPLAVERAEAAATALLAALHPVPPGGEIRYQVIMTSAGTPSRVPTPHEGKDSSLASWWEGTLSTDAEAVGAARLKQRETLLRVVVRVGVGASNQAQVQALFGRVWPVLHITNAPSVRVRRRWLPSAVVAGRMTRRAYPITKWPMLLNAAEAAALVGLPVGNVRLPGLSVGTARQLPPLPTMPAHGAVVAVSNYPGMSDRPLALTASDRLRHMFVLGPTGSGKSWMLARMILQDIAAGSGVVVIDPKGDLITDVLARVDDRDSERVVVLDASKRDMPVGLNVLGHAHNEEAQELAVDNVLHVFREIWSKYWGPRSDQIMRAGLAALVHTRAPDGSAMTLCELMPLLTQPALRRYVTSQSSLPDSLRAFWQWYDQISDGERLQAIGPVSNKVEAFTGRTPIRLMLGQSTGLDLASVFRERRVVLVSLAKGTLGAETANLLGALLVSTLWQATLERVRVPAARRRPVFAYIDEAGDIMRLPLALADVLAQARGLGLGVVAATQIIAQVPESVRAALLGTVRTQLTFAVEHDDATVLARRFAPLSVDDLTNLGTYEIAMRPCVDGTTAAPVTGITLPLNSPVRDPEDLAGASRQRYGAPRNEVEAKLRARVDMGAARPGGRFGREAVGGES